MKTPWYSLTFAGLGLPAQQDGETHRGWVIRNGVSVVLSNATARFQMSPKQSDAIIDTVLPPRPPRANVEWDRGELEWYGGRFVCESVYPEYRSALLAALNQADARGEIGR